MNHNSPQNATISRGFPGCTTHFELPIALESPPSFAPFWPLPRAPSRRGSRNAGATWRAKGVCRSALCLKRASPPRQVPWWADLCPWKSGIFDDFWKADSWGKLSSRNSGVPSGKRTSAMEYIAIYSEFFHEKWWISFHGYLGALSNQSNES